MKILKTIAYMTLAFWLTTTPAWASGEGLNPQNLLRDALEQIQGLGAAGAIAFIALYIVVTIAFLPASLLTLGAGVVFGVVLGSIYVFIGATLGAILAFLVGRYLARGWVSRKIEGNPQFKAIDQAVGKEGFKIVLLTRLSPAFPFNLLNYAFGVTQVSFRDYFLGFVGMIPGTVMYVYIGSLARDLTAIGSTDQTASSVQWTIQVIGLIATIVVTLYVTKVARKALAESVETQSSEQS
jgi:uncharacterized membrane protein YdjX (TVP38/TMEM64 family)